MKIIGEQVDMETRLESTGASSGLPDNGKTKGKRVRRVKAGT